MSKSQENFSFKDNSDRKYFCMIPHAIYEIGLKGNEIAVYGAIKRAAGESSNCTKSKPNLAKSAGVCKKSIFNIIKRLCETNKFLGKPLILCHSRHTENGEWDTNMIEIVDIWKECICLIEKIEKKFGEVNITLPNVNVTTGVGYPLPQGRVTVTHKEESIKKNPDKEQQQPQPLHQEKRNSVVVVFSSLEKFSDDQVPRDAKIDISEKYPEQRVNDAVESVLQPEFDPRESILKALYAACKRGWKPPKKKEDYSEINKKLALDVIKRKHRFYKFELLSKEFEIIRGGQMEPVAIKLTENPEKFKKTIEETLKEKI